jgi:hypothetical protein
MLKTKKIDIAPKIATLYCVRPDNKEVIEHKNCVLVNECYWDWGKNFIFFETEYLLEYEDTYGYIKSVTIDKYTKTVKKNSLCFFDYEEAVAIHKEKRILYLKIQIEQFKQLILIAKEWQKEEDEKKYAEEIKRCKEELKEIEK